MLAIKCVDKLVKYTRVKYSNNTNEDWSLDANKDLNASTLNRCGKYFEINKNFWFLGITLGKFKNKFCLAFNGEKKSDSFKMSKGDSWSYCEVPDSILKTCPEQKQLELLLKFIEGKLGKKDERHY